MFLKINAIVEVKNDWKMYADFEDGEDEDICNVLAKAIDASLPKYISNAIVIEVEEIKDRSRN